MNDQTTPSPKKTNWPVIISILLVVGILCCCGTAGGLYVAAMIYGWDTTDYERYSDIYDIDFYTDPNDNSDDNTDSDTTTDTDTDTNDDTNNSQEVEYKEGTIEGSLSYPSEYIPEDMQICARASVAAASAFCTSDHITDSRYTYGVGYKLTVPYGQYYVYAQPDDTSNYLAYYTEYVQCGMTENCTSHDWVVVTVSEANPHVENIDPGDWYAQ
jgi:hypothetical protein